MQFNVNAQDTLSFVYVYVCLSTVYLPPVYTTPIMIVMTVSLNNKLDMEHEFYTNETIDSMSI